MCRLLQPRTRKFFIQQRKKMEAPIMNKTEITNDEHRKQEENLKRNLGKLQLTHLWFG